MAAISKGIFGLPDDVLAKIGSCLSEAPILERVNKKFRLVVAPESYIAIWSRCLTLMEEYKAQGRGKFGLAKFVSDVTDAPKRSLQMKAIRDCCPVEDPRFIFGAICQQGIRFTYTGMKIGFESLRGGELFLKKVNNPVDPINPVVLVKCADKYEIYKRVEQVAVGVRVIQSHMMYLLMSTNV